MVESANNPGTLYIVPTPIGNLEDITLRALNVLKAVALIAAEDTRSARHLLDHFQINRPKLISLFDANESRRITSLVEALRAGQDVAVVSEAGMPGISDPGFRIIREVTSQEIPVVVLPGASAAITALVGSGLSTATFYFAGFLPRQSGDRRRALFDLRALPCTLVFYEAPHRIRESLDDMASVFGADRQVAIARELTKIHEQYVRSTLGEINQILPDDSIRGEFTVVVEGSSDEANFDLEQEVLQRLANGESPKEIATLLTTVTGISKRKIYELGLVLANKKGPTE